MTYANHGADAPQKTAIAAVVAVLMVIPALVPAALVTFVYTFFFNIISGGVSWIPYVDEIGAMWFPELLRGLLVGAIAGGTSRYFFPRSNIEAVRLATLARSSCFF